MPYEIWQSLSAKQQLQIIEQTKPEVVQKIWDQLSQYKYGKAKT